MYISKVRLTNVRCFKDATINLDCSPKSLLLTGNNGTGKSAVLRSIAMGLCDEASAGGLLRELPGDFIRDGEKSAEIEIWISAEGEENWIILTELALYGGFNFERVHQKYYKNKIDRKNEVKWENFPWEKMFVAGYGAGLRTEGTEDYDQYFSGDAVYTLFKHSQTLQNPELAWRRLESVVNNDKSLKDKINKDISEILHKVLGLENGTEVQLKPNGIFMSKGNQQGEDVEIGSTGDGYRAITTLTLDLLSWQFLMQNKNFDKDSIWEPLLLGGMRGIVIIDEIEKHMHPLLQREIIKHLYEKFKNLQFIISTHSPLCVSGTADIGEYEDPRYKIYCTYEKEDKTAGLEKNAIPFGLRYEQILMDYFKLPAAINIELEKKVNRMRELFAQNVRTPQQDEELKLLGEELEKITPMAYEKEENRRIKIEIKKNRELLLSELKKLNDQG